VSRGCGARAVEGSVEGGEKRSRAAGVFGGSSTISGAAGGGIKIACGRSAGVFGRRGSSFDLDTSLWTARDALLGLSLAFSSEMVDCFVDFFGDTIGSVFMLSVMQSVKVGMRN
jgi:hypothetical protein